MSAPRFIQKLRAKPVHVRERILLVSMLIVGACMLGVWLLTFRKPRDIEPKNNAVVRFGEYLGSSVKNIFSTGSAYFTKPNPPVGQ